MAGNLVPKQTIATRADGSTYETTVHVRAEDDGATNFKVPNRGAPVSAVASSRDPGLPDRVTPDGTLARMIVSDEGHEVPFWTVASRNLGDGKTEFYAPLDADDRDDLYEIEDEYQIRIDPQELIVPGDDHNHGLPVYRIIGSRSRYDRASRSSNYGASTAYFAEYADARPKGEGDARAPKSIDWSEFDHFDPRTSADGTTTTVSDIGMAPDYAAEFNKDRFIKSLEPKAAKYGVTLEFGRESDGSGHPTANLSGPPDNVYRFLDDYENGRPLE